MASTAPSVLKRPIAWTRPGRLFLGMSGMSPIRRSRSSGSPASESISAAAFHKGLRRLRRYLPKRLRPPQGHGNKGLLKDRLPLFQVHLRKLVLKREQGRNRDILPVAYYFRRSTWKVPTARRSLSLQGFPQGPSVGSCQPSTRFIVSFRSFKSPDFTT